MGLNDTPLATDTIKDSAAPINQNFITYIDPQFAVNHVGFNTGLNSGKHNVCQYPLSTFNTAIDLKELALLNDTSPFTANKVLKLILGGSIKANAIGINDFKNGVVGGASPIMTNAGWTYLPTGLIMKWGTVSFAPGGYNLPLVIRFPTNPTSPNKIPVFSERPRFIMVTPLVTSGTFSNAIDVIRDNTLTEKQFTITSVNNFDASESIMYLAIGY